MSDSCSSEIDYKIISFILGASTAFMLLLVMLMSMYIKRVLKLKEATPLDTSFVFKPRVTARRNGGEGSFSVNTHNPMYDPQSAQPSEGRVFESRGHSFESRPTIRARNTEDPPFSDIASVVGGRALSVVHSESSHITNGLGRHLSGFDRDIAQLDNSDSGSNVTHVRGTSAQIKQQRAAANARKRMSSLDRSRDTSMFDIESAHNKSTEDIESLDFGWPDVESDSDSPHKADLERQRRSIHAEAEKREREEADLAVVDEATTLPGMSFHDSRAHAADDNEI